MPVSNLAFISNIKERTVLDQLNQHCTYNDIHSVFHSGYKENHSCKTALLEVVNDMCNGMYKGNSSSCTGFKCTIWHCQSYHSIESFGQQLWDDRWCTRLVSIISLSWIDESACCIRLFNYWNFIKVHKGHCRSCIVQLVCQHHLW